MSLAPQRSDTGDWEQWRYFRGFGQVTAVQRIGSDVEEGTGRVLIHGLNDLTIAEEPLDKTWSQFFPSIELSRQNTFPYPRPYTVEFCQLYGEPLFDFCNAANLLAGAISHLGRNPPTIKGDPKVAREQAVDSINLLRRPIVSVLDFEESGSLKSRRVAPSLLASFADMFAEDLVYGRTTLQCACCGTLFVSSAYQAKYCSVTCRLREQKRHLRAQRKQAKALRAQGQSLRQIAASLQQPLGIVKGWLEGVASRKKTIAIPATREAPRRNPKSSFRRT